MRNWRRKKERETDSDHVRDSDSDSDSASDESSSTDESDFVVSESEISYSIESFNAIATPVTITMVVSALVVVFINTDESNQIGEESFARYYQILAVGNDQSAAQNFGNSLFNTLVIVAVICVLTFLVVLCYKFRCMKFFYAYMVLVTAGLLGFFTYQILMVAFSIYPWMQQYIDKLSLTYILYNYAAVGTVSIFLPRGFPKWVPQGYLIAGSVCMAWELSFFNAWMTWTLLVMLALYDLYAVLSPYGPLKALANLISQEGAPALPGMIYEADLPAGAERRSRNSQHRSSERSQGQQRDEPNGGSAISGENENSNGTNFNALSDPSTGQLPESQTALIHEPHPDTASRTNSITQQKPRRYRNGSQSRRQMDNNEDDGNVSVSLNTSIRSTFTGQVAQSGHQQILYHQNDEQNTSSNARGTVLTLSQPASVDMSNKGRVPLVLANMYKLPVLDKKGVLRPRVENLYGRAMENTANEGDEHGIRSQPIYYTADEIQEMELTPQQLKTVVTCIFPPRGGRIAKAKSREQKYAAGTAYIVYSRSGNQQRKFVVTPMGSVKEVLRREASGNGADDNGGDDGDKRNTIKLGIGDFIFYSLLVSQAAQDSFTAFASCLLVVLSGLAATLVILAIKGKALPALPISVFFGVIAFLWTTTFLEPWVRDFIGQSIYV